MKYLHIMLNHFYTKKFIDTIQNNFNFNEHQFIIIEHKNNKLHRDLEKSHNIKSFKLSENILIKFFTFKYKTIRKLMYQSEYIFIHCLTDYISCILFRFKGKAKISWIVWGGDLYNYLPVKLYDFYTSKLLVKIEGKIKSIFLKGIFFLFYSIRKSIMKKIDYLLSETKGDIKLLRKWFNTKAEFYSKFNYRNPVDFENLDKEVNYIEDKYKFKKDCAKLILLGNSGEPTNNHLDIMIRLSKMKNQDFKIICPLSYGPPKYIDKIIEKGKTLFGDRFFPLIEFLKPEIYYHILKQIDLTIMYHNRQQGYGTIIILLYLGKPLCMKKTSIFFNLGEKGLFVFSIQDLEKLISNEIVFTEAMSENNKRNISKYHISKYQSIKSHASSIKNLFNYLENRNK